MRVSVGWTLKEFETLGEEQRPRLYKHWSQWTKGKPR